MLQYLLYKQCLQTTWNSPQKHQQHNQHQWLHTKLLHKLLPLQTEEMTILLEADKNMKRANNCLANLKSNTNVNWTSLKPYSNLKQLYKLLSQLFLN